MKEINYFIYFLIIYLTYFNMIDLITIKKQKFIIFYKKIILLDLIKIFLKMIILFKNII